MQTERDQEREREKKKERKKFEMLREWTDNETITTTLIMKQYFSFNTKLKTISSIMLLHFIISNVLKLLLLIIRLDTFNFVHYLCADNQWSVFEMILCQYASQFRTYSFSHLKTLFSIWIAWNASTKQASFCTVKN